MSKYTENFPNLSTYDFDTIMCQLKQVCGADPSGLINAQFLSRPTTAKDIALLLHITYELFQSQVELQKQFVELYTFVKDFFENLDLQEEVNKWLDESKNNGVLKSLFGNAIVFKSNVSPLMSNNNGCVSDLFNCALTYLNSEKLYYGNFYTATDYKNNPINGVDETGRYQIDCSSFVELVLNGTDFDASRYNGISINQNNRTYHFSYYNENNGENGFTADYPKYRYTYQQAIFAKESGYGFINNYNWTNVFPGDIVWLNEDETTPITGENPLGVDHCMIYFGRHISGDLMFLEAGGIISNAVEILNTNGVIKLSRRTLSFMNERAKMIARFPLGNGNVQSVNLMGELSVPFDCKEETTNFVFANTIKKGTIATLYIEYSGSAPIVVLDSGYLGYSQPQYIERLTFPIIAKNDFIAVGVRGLGCKIYNIKLYEGYASGNMKDNDTYTETSIYDQTHLLSRRKVKAIKTNNGYGIVSSNDDQVVGLFNISDLPFFVKQNESMQLALSRNFQKGTIQVSKATTNIEFEESFKTTPVVVASPIGSEEFFVGVSDVTLNGFNVACSSYPKYISWIAISE